MHQFNPEEAIIEAQREFGEHGGVTPSIERSSTFTVMEPGIMPEIFAGIKGPRKGGYYLYSRHFNPTVNVLDRYLAAMEGTEFAVSTASGMSAIACTLLQLCHNNDHLVAADTIYGGTHAMFEKIFSEMGITTTFVDPRDVSAFEKAITKKTKAIYVETLANPTLKLADIRELSKIAHSYNVKLIVDNTFTPMIISPAKLGADIVVYSLTKFINGGSDLIAGAICGDLKFIYELMDLHKGRIMLLGPTLDPRIAFDIIQRLPHLAIRMREHSMRSLAIAEHLEKYGLKVCYPGLKTYPQYELFNSMMNKGFGYGGMLTLDCGTKEKAFALMSELQNVEKFGLLAVSLGYSDTLISCSSSTTSSEISDEEQQKIGLPQGLLRFSIGITGSLESRIKQLDRAIKKTLL